MKRREMVSIAYAEAIMEFMTMFKLDIANAILGEGQADE
jgi:hypothetical protein